MSRMRTLGAVLGVSAMAGATALALSPVASPPPAAAAVVPFAAQAPDSAFTSQADAGGPAACTRPAPDNRVSTTIHCYTPDQLRAHYGLGPLASSNDGAGQTIVLVDAYGSPTAADDLNFFAQTFGGPAPDFEAVSPLGTPDYKNPTGKGVGQSGPNSAAGWAGEANLDVQWAYAMAPKAHIVLLSTPPAETQGVQGVPNLMKAIDWAIQKYPSGTVFSMSFGTDEQTFGSASAAKSQFAKFDQTFQRGLAKGDTFFASSGDDGSTGYVRSHRAGTVGSTPEVSYPNVSPYVTSVGGTQVQSGWTWNPTQDVPYLADGARNPAYWAWNAGGESEAVWNEGGFQIGTGGGLSTVYSRPAFQDGVAGVVGTARGVPDLAWNAAVNGGVLVFHSYFPSTEGPAAWGVYGGTSAASPQAAAATAIANQARAAAGKGPIGDLNKALYSGSFDKSAAFGDIVPLQYGTTPSGDLASNRMWALADDGSLTPNAVPGYATTGGYDLTTGWGAPRMPGYVDQLVAQ
ncbi:Pseudomonalisin precursor [Microbacterium azadirachtae]|uniref:Pseudomonalisin n=1 Tax=Microbacterium azadirachtae TaxID=582680 RepID=A0A0F0KHD8_9MICO|nr:S53 family peptidase [Microbacterium azadirachtae]KJL19570.1 Pseudomonalisin precursor [Microbacterium azadirachtae]